MSKTALTNAAYNCNISNVRANIKLAGMVDGEGWTALMWAVGCSDMNCLNELIDKEARLAGKNGCTALMRAASLNDVDKVRLLLCEAQMQTKERITQICNTNVNSPAGSTALMIAARKGFYKIVELLLPYEQGMKDSEGHTAQWHANQGGNMNCISLLKNEGTSRLPPPPTSAELPKLQERVNKLSMENKSLKKELASSKAAREEAEGKNKQLAAEKMDIQNDLDERDGHIRVLEEVLKENEQQYKVLVDEVSALNKDNTALKDQVNKIQQRLAKTEEERRVVHNDANEARARAEQLQKENDKQKNALDATKRQLQEMSEERDRLAAQLSHSEELCRDLTGEVTGLQKRVEEEKNEKEQNASTIDRLTTEITSLKEQLNKTTEERNTFHKQLEDEKKHGKARNDKLFAEVKSLQGQLSSAKNDLDKTKKELSQSISEVSSFYKHLSETTEAIKKELSSSNTAREEAEGKLSQMNRDATSLKQQLQKANDEAKKHESLQKALEQNQTLMAHLKEENNNRQARIEELIAEKTSLRDKLSLLEKAQEGAEERLAQSNQEIDLLMKQLEDEKQQSKDRINELSAEVESLQGQLSSSKNDLDETKKKSSQLSREVSSLKQKTQEAETSLSEAKNEVDSLKEQLSHSNTDSEALKRELADQKDRNISLEKEVVQLKSESQDVRNLQAERDDLQRRLEEAEERNRDLLNNLVVAGGRLVTGSIDQDS